MNDTLQTLRLLDAAAPPAPDNSTAGDTAARHRDAMLHRILAAPQTTPARRPTGSRTSRRLVIGAVAFALTVPVIASGVHVAVRQLNPTSHGLTDLDLASWTDTATPRTAAQLSPAAKTWCITATNRQVGPDASVHIFGGDERGKVASILIDRDGNLDICLANRAGGGGFWELVSNPTTPLPSVTNQEVLLQSTGEQGSNNIGTAWGQAGPDIRTVTLRLDGRTIHTTVNDGIWNAWWPDATSTDLPTTATVTDTNGHITTVPVYTP